MSPEARSGPRWVRPAALAAALAVPALLSWLFWRTTPPVGGYAHAPSAPTQGRAPVAPTTLDAALLYARNCASCHGTEMEGTPRGLALKRADWPYAGRRDLLVRTLHEGRGLRMPSFRGRLSQQQIEALADHLETANRAPAP